MTFIPQLHHVQVQSLAVTPQLIQSIQLLQYSGQELDAFLKDQLEKNPLIKIAKEDRKDGSESMDGVSPTSLESTPASPNQADQMWHDRQSAFRQMQCEPPRDQRSPKSQLRSVGLAEGHPYNLEERCAVGVSLREHLRSQLMIACRHQPDLIIGLEIIESIDANGYLCRELTDIANVLAIEEAKAVSILEIIQTFEPTGVGARSLAECLEIQLRERNRLNTPMSMLLSNLTLLADFRISELAKICGVGTDDVLEMAKEIRKLDPRPGRSFDNDPTIPAMPDVMVTMNADGTFTVELNSALLPKVLVDREYYSKVSAGCKGKHEKEFVVDCWRSANWLARNLDQRAQTILRVATEVMLRQRDFLIHGAEHLRPLSLKDVAQAVGLHESTVSRATANKYVSTSRGTFELKYFFKNSIASSDGSSDFSSETIRHKIKHLIDDETAESVLSDDAIVVELRRSGVDIARRTIAKYRDAMNIGSSLQRRRQKQALKVSRQ